MGSVENDMEIINTSTVSLSRSHYFFNKSNESLNCTTGNSSQVVENPLNILSDVMSIDQIEASLNVGTETVPSNYDAFVIAHSSRELNDTDEELENIQPLSLSKNYIDVVNKPTETMSLETSSQEENGNHENLLYPTILTKDITNKDTMMAEGVRHDEVLGTSFNTSCNNLMSTENDNNIPYKEVITEVNSNKKRRVTSKFMKSCMDFLTDSEDKDFSSGSSNLWSDKEETSDGSEGHDKNRKRKKTKSKKNNTKTNQTEIIPIKKKKPENKRKSRKQLKEKGLSYETISGNVKEARKLQENPCKEGKCSRKCHEITEERRKSIFDYFWALNDDKNGIGLCNVLDQSV